MLLLLLLFHLRYVICRKEWDPPFWPVDGFDGRLFLLLVSGKERRLFLYFSFVNGYT